MTTASAKLVRQSTTDLVADALRKKILTGALLPGSPLRQEAIAEELGVSRIPVREAIQRLEAEGMIDLVAHKGAFVCTLSQQELSEIFEARFCLEPWLLGVAIPLMQPGDLIKARLIIDQMWSADGPSWGSLNWAFHETLYKAAGRDMILGMLKSLHDKADRYHRLQLMDANIREEAHAEHAEIALHCERGDVKRAAKALDAHIRVSYKQMANIVGDMLSKDRAA